MKFLRSYYLLIFKIGIFRQQIIHMNKFSFQKNFISKS